jgi:hypothetical protein
MTRYYNLGLNIFFEVSKEGIFAYHFKKGALETRTVISENISILAEEIKDWEYYKALDKRVLFFSKKFE